MATPPKFKLKTNKIGMHVTNGLLEQEVSANVHRVLNKVIGAFYVVGDMYHNPICFGPSDINDDLPDLGNKSCWKELVHFLFGQPRVWQIAVYHFLEFDGIVQVVPMRMIVDDITLGLVADMVTPFANHGKTMLFEMEEYKGLEQHYVNYSYYINWGNDIDFDVMDEVLPPAFFKVTRDLSAVGTKLAVINGKNLIDNLHKSPHVNAGVAAGVELTTDMVEITEEFLKELGDGRAEKETVSGAIVPEDHVVGTDTASAGGIDQCFEEHQSPEL